MTTAAAIRPLRRYGSYQSNNNMAREKIYDTAIQPETAVLVGIVLPHVGMEKSRAFVAALALWVETAGWVVIATLWQKLTPPDRGTVVGSGKIDKIKAFVKADEVDMVIFDDELSPTQPRNVEPELGVK